MKGKGIMKIDRRYCMNKINRFLHFLLPLCFLVGCNIKHKTITSSQAIESIYPPTIMIDGTLYQDSGYINNLVTCGTADDMINSSVNLNELPTKDNQSNFGTGYEYQIWNDGYINVKLDHKWVAFVRIDKKSLEIPDFVANFQAEVLETTNDTLLVKITELPEDFQFLFPSSIEHIKPISLSSDYIISKEDKKEFDLHTLVGKKVHVHFDGSMQHTQPESSIPIQLNKIYRIVIVE